MARYSFKSFRTFGRGPVPALFIALLAACGRSSPPTPTLAQKISTECLQPADKEYYFPNGTLDPRRVYDVAHQEEYSTRKHACPAVSNHGGCATSSQTTGVGTLLDDACLGTLDGRGWLAVGARGPHADWISRRHPQESDRRHF